MTSGIACPNCWASRLRLRSAVKHTVFPRATVETWRCGACYRLSHRLVLNYTTVAGERVFDTHPAYAMVAS